MSRGPLIRRHRLVPEPGAVPPHPALGPATSDALPAAAASAGHALGHYSIQRQTDAVAEGAEAETSTAERGVLVGPVRTATWDASIHEGGMAERPHLAHRIAVPRVQTRLAVSQPGDPSEQEAEQMADQMAEHGMSSASDSERARESKPQDERQRMRIYRAALAGPPGVSDDLERQLSAHAGQGSQLSDEARASMESRFGFNFANVRVHTDAQAAQWNRDLNARAFTYGQDIYFSAGSYDPMSSAGRRLLAHELTHVVQQTGVEADSAPGTAGGIHSVARAMIQRDLTEGQKKSWTDRGGDQIISRVKVAVEAWKVFRQKPGKYSEMPRQSTAASELAELVRALSLQSTAYPQYAADQLGTEAVAYLTEMAAFMPEYRGLIRVIPGVAYVPPEHRYKMTLKHEGPTPEAVNPFIQVEYTNAFKHTWEWRQSLVGMQLSWSVGISRDLRKNKVEGGSENPLIPQPGLISISSNCIATPTGYWGYQDLAGPVLIANGPKLTGTFHGFGGKAFNTGGMISIMGLGDGPPGSLDFMNLEAKVVDLQFKTAENAKDLGKDAEVSLSLVEAAAGAVVRYGEAEVAIADLQPTPVPEETVWRYVYSGFETGSAEAPIPDGEVKSVLDLIDEDISDKRKNVESIKPYLDKAGIKQDFKLDFYCEGYASRRWLGAGTNDKVRLQKNQHLSEQRAQNVTSMLNARFGSEHTYSFAGKGAAIDLPEPDKRFGNLIAENGNEDLIEQLIRERAEQYQKDRAGLSPDEARKAAEQDRKSIEANLGKTSNNTLARRVNITVTWSGYNVQWSAPLM